MCPNLLEIHQTEQSISKIEQFHLPVLVTVM